MKSLKYIISIATLINLSTPSAMASNSLSTKIHNQYVSWRALGMGNTFTAVADDYTLIYYNPAGFAKKKNNEVQFTIVGGGVAMKTLDFAKDLTDAEKSATTDEDKAIAISNVLDKYYGETMGGRVQAAELFWIRKNWGISLVPVDLSLDLTIDRQVGPTVDLNMVKDTTLAFGYGQSYNNNIDWGVTVKGIHRLEAQERLVALELAANSNLVSEDRAKEGFSVDADLGVMYSPSWFGQKETRMPASVSAKKKKSKKKVDPAQLTTALANGVSTTIQREGPHAQLNVTGDVTSGTTVISTVNAESASATLNQEIQNAVATSGTAVVPTVAEETKEEDKAPEEVVVMKDYQPLTFSAVARNVFGGQFTKQTLMNKKAISAPDKLPMVFDVGVNYDFVSWGDLTMRAMADLKNLNHPKLTSYTKGLHLGVEFDYSPSGWFKTQFRTGLNQGYYTAGATLLLGIFNIEAVTYGEEVGTSSNKLQNRVYAAKVGMNF